MATTVGPTGRVVGLDASRELIAQAVARTRDLGLPLVYQVGDAHAREFPDNAFDCARAERVGSAVAACRSSNRTGRA